MSPHSPFIKLALHLLLAFFLIDMVSTGVPWNKAGEAAEDAGRVFGKEPWRPPKDTPPFNEPKKSSGGGASGRAGHETPS
ncbi:hypothetical protein HDV00_012754, partial [Rhizophlyctis rosea]